MASLQFSSVLSFRALFLPETVMEKVCSLVGKFFSLLVLLVAILIGVYNHVYSGELRSVTQHDSILITGCSSGIGKHAALTMNALGFKVFAGIRKTEAGVRLKDEAAFPEKMIPVILDVTKDDQIANAVKFVEEEVGEDGLTALYNNAGIHPLTNENGNSVEHHPESSYRWIMEVNYFGVLKITKAFLPLVKKSKNGRIVFNTSIFGFFVSGFVSPYASSKYAVEALADALRREVYYKGVKVSILEPGVIWSEMSCEPILLDDAEIRSMKENYKGSYQEHEFVDVRQLFMTAEPPTLTSKDLVDAVLNTIPKDRYISGGLWQIWYLYSKLPTMFVDDQINKFPDPMPLKPGDAELALQMCKNTFFDKNEVQTSEKFLEYIQKEW